MLLLGAAVYIQNRDMYQAPEYSKRTTGREVVLTRDFEIENVLDNTPFGNYYSPVKRNPFIPVKPKVSNTIGDTESIIKKINPNFKWPWQETKPKIEKKPEPVKGDVAVTNLPMKNPVDEKPPQKIDPTAQKKDKTIPVYLIGFAKESEGATKPRKAILANKKTGELYTLKTGENLLSMTIVEITPYSVIIKMDDGRKVEFLNDILKE